MNDIIPADLSLPQFIDRFHFADPRGRDAGFCGLLWRPLPDGRLLVVAFEHPDNPGQSITNAAETVYACFLEETGADPRRAVWAECYPPDGSERRSAFDRCTFTESADGYKPDWQPMTPAAWDELGVSPPAMPTFTRVRPHPETNDDDVPLPDNIGDYHPPQRPVGPRGEVVYSGERIIDDEAGTAELVVTVTGAHGTRPLHPRLDLRDHSPTGFEWGYGGSGPAQLTLAILADLLGDAAATRQYHDFKFAVVARLPYNRWELTAADVRRVLAELEKQAQTDSQEA